MMIFTEVLPSVLLDIVCPTTLTPHRPHTAEDIAGYKTVNDAIVDGEILCARLSKYVRAENILFVLSQSIEALSNYPFYIEECPMESDVLADRLKQYSGEQYRRQQEDDADKRAVVFCKLAEADMLNKISAGEEKDCGSRGKYKEVSWLQLQKLNRRLQKIGHD